MIRQKIKKVKNNPWILAEYILRQPLAHYIPDKIFLKIMFYIKVHYFPDLNNPITFNEKIQWLKLHDRNVRYTAMVDKSTAKKIAENMWGEQYIIPTLGIWDSFNQIDFDLLPNQFVLKCTHNSGGVIIVKDKKTLNRNTAKKKIEKSLKENYYYNSREWPYKNVMPRIIAEKYISQSEQDSLNDYKLMCFNGEVKCSFTCSNRFGKEGLYVNFYDKDWKPMPFIRKYPKNPVEIKKPQNYEKMVELAEKVSKNIPFLRVDFYECNGKIYFGEFTFYPGSGMEWFEPFEWDRKLGEMISLKQILEKR